MYLIIKSGASRILKSDMDLRTLTSGHYRSVPPTLREYIGLRQDNICMISTAFRTSLEEGVLYIYRQVLPPIKS